MTENTTLDMNYRFNETELAEISAYGEIIHHDEGDVLFTEGDNDVDLCIVVSGQLNVYLTEHGEERRVGWLEPGQFSGDVSMITGQRSLVTARMENAGEVLHIKPAALQKLLIERSGLSDAIVTAFIARRAWARSSGRASVVLIGRAFDQQAFAIRELLTKHAVPFLWVEADADPQAATTLDRLNLTLDDAPVLVAGAETTLVKPSITEVSKTLGLDLLPDNACADVVVIGAGPAGLAASVYAASEGLSTVTLDASAPGGQAGASSKIENYLGFPSGVSGRELAERAAVQAQKFGARLAAPATVAALEKLDDTYCIRLEDGRSLRARAVVIASGAQYRRLPIDGLEAYEGRGIYYGATAMEAQICKDSEIAIVGAGNSAGQGAVFLSGYAKAVHVLYRRPEIRDTMSDYLVRRLEETENIHLHPQSEITDVDGDGDRIRSVEMTTGGEKKSTLNTPFLFLFIGAVPQTDWLPDTVARDDKGFLITGASIENIKLVRAGWDLDRMPTVYETNWPRLYAVGDVRAGSVKRVASGVGEGSVVVQHIHQALGEV